jgi:hypothetical protein
MNDQEHQNKEPQHSTIIQEAHDHSTQVGQVFGNFIINQFKRHPALLWGTLGLAGIGMVTVLVLFSMIAGLLRPEAITRLLSRPIAEAQTDSPPLSLTPASPTAIPEPTATSAPTAVPVPTMDTSDITLPLPTLDLDTQNSDLTTLINEYRRSNGVNELRPSYVFANLAAAKVHLLILGADGDLLNEDLLITDASKLSSWSRTGNMKENLALDNAGAILDDLIDRRNQGDALLDPGFSRVGASWLCDGNRCAYYVALGK